MVTLQGNYRLRKVLNLFRIYDRKLFFGLKETSFPIRELRVIVMDIGWHFNLDGHFRNSVLLLQQGHALAGELISTIPIGE